MTLLEKNYLGWNHMTAGRFLVKTKWEKSSVLMLRKIIFLLIICMYSCSTKNIIDKKGDELYEAASKGDYYKVQELLNQGVDVNYKKQLLSHDEYPLNGAVRSGNLEIVKLLIMNKAIIDTETDDRGTLNNAIWVGNKKIIQYLISKGIYINISCSSSLIFSALSSVSFEMLRFVVDDLGVCIDSKDYFYGDTPLYKNIYDERIQEAAYLIKKGANINAQNKKKQTPLHEAVISGKTKMIELLLKNGADVHIKDEKGLSPLDYAKKENNPRVLALLKRYGK